MLRPMSPPTSIASTPLHCLLDADPPCAWCTHDYKHSAARGVGREDTRHGPARYLAMPQDEWRALEVETVRHPMHRRGSIQSNKTEYVRSMGRVIGWDAGQDATLSYVECSGGLVSGRTFHGRPMCPDNRTVRSMKREGA
jgi:hypothetical protein